MKKLGNILIAGWPVIVAIVGGLIMILAGVDDCPGCKFWGSLKSMSSWGWIGFGLVNVAIIAGISLIIRAFINAYNSWRSF